MKEVGLSGGFNFTIELFKGFQLEIAFRVIEIEGVWQLRFSQTITAGGQSIKPQLFFRGAL